jgi:hypothetical protein
MSEMDQPPRFTGAAPEGLAVGYVRTSAEPAQPSAEKQKYLLSEYVVRRGLRLANIFEEGAQ